MRGAAENRCVSSSNRSKTAKKLARRARADGYVFADRREYPLHGNNGQVITSMLKDAVREAGHDPQDPGCAVHLWFEDLDMVVIDLRAEEGENA